MTGKAGLVFDFVAAKLQNEGDRGGGQKALGITFSKNN